jgi:hypothetical protein
LTHFDEADLLVSYGKAPLAVAKNGGVWPDPDHRFVLAACARWESRYIVEWIIYHQSIGIDHIYLYCNDDQPDEMYRAVLPFVTGPNPFVTFVHYNFTGLQFQMYFHFLRNYSHQSRWLMFLDIDEFLCLRGTDDIEKFMTRFPEDTDAVYFNWSSFGHNGHLTRPNTDVLTTYTRRERTVTPFTKVFIKSSAVPYEEFFRWTEAPVMHDYTCLNSQLKVVNAIGDNVSNYYSDFPAAAWRYLLADEKYKTILNTAFVAHYNIKSDEDFVLRTRRGLKGDYASEKMWGEKDELAKKQHHKLTNEVEDLYLAEYWRNYVSRGRLLSVFPISKWTILSEGCFATQSSTAHSRSIELDAASLVSGKLTGKCQNHTQLESNPWWGIRLAKISRVHEIRLFNRLDGVRERMANFAVYSSSNGNDWSIQYVKRDDLCFGGADGSPFVWIDEDGFDALWLRIVVPGLEKYFHLDQVQIFGH